MNDIDFIKKCCEFAEGFEYKKETANCAEIVLYQGGTCALESLKNRPILYPLLIQRAIEGLNEAHNNIGNNYPIITQDQRGIEVFIFDSGTTFLEFIDYESKEDCKREALEYTFRALTK